MKPKRKAPRKPMAYKLKTPDKKLLDWIAKLPAEESAVTAWKTALQERGTTVELFDEIQKKVSELEDSKRTQFLAELTVMKRQWLLAEQSKSFRHR